MSSIVELTTTPTEPVDLATAQTFLRVQSGTDDALIQNVIIPGARRQLETSTGLTLASRNFVQYEDGFPFFPYFQSPYAPLFGAAFPFYFGYGPIASYPYPAIGGLSNQMVNPFLKRLLRSPVTAVDHIEYIGTDGKSHGLLPGKDFIVDFSSTPGRLAPLPGQRWPVGIMGINTVKIFFTAGYLPPASSNISESLGAIWAALTSVTQNSYVIDSNRNIEIQLLAGAKTGTAEPSWPDINATVAETNSEGVTTSVWKNIGSVLGPWAAGHLYSAPSVIVDPNGYLQMLIVGTLTAGGSTPTFSRTFGAVTTDNSTPAWMNIGIDQSEGAADPPDEITDVVVNNSIPPNLYMAVLQFIVHWYQQRAVVVTSAGAGGTHIPLPFHLQEIINSERIWDFETTP